MNRDKFQKYQNSIELQRAGISICASIGVSVSLIIYISHKTRGEYWDVSQIKLPVIGLFLSSLIYFESARKLEESQNSYIINLLKQISHTTFSISIFYFYYLCDLQHIYNINLAKIIVTSVFLTVCMERIITFLNKKKKRRH